MSLRLRGNLEQIAAEFSRIQTQAELAALLEISPDRLHFLAYKKRSRRYRTFLVQKRRGGFRLIREPTAGLKVLQQKLNQILQVLYKPRDCVHGFVPGRSIGTNSQIHVGAGFILNVDLKDFFPSINFGRVRGMLMSAPYRIAPDIATIVAQICCDENQLPQGAPSSPVLSNMVCGKLDSEFVRLARRCRCEYTRYADDITFSGVQQIPPRLLAHKDDWSDNAAPVSVGPRLLSLVEGNGFLVNTSKVRVRRRFERQEVTGLTVNEKPNVSREYIRSLRSVLYDWQRNGLVAAEQRYLAQDTKDRAPHSDNPRLPVILKGKIDFLAMIRGKNDPLYRKFALQYNGLIGGFPRPAHRQRPNHLRNWQDAIWVIETDLDLAEQSGADLAQLSEDRVVQGTGFFLKGYGFVTCAHVARGAFLVVYDPQHAQQRYRAGVHRMDPQLDLAVLTVDAAAPYEFIPSRANVHTGDMVRVMGYPHHDNACSLFVAEGRVTALHGNYEGHPRYYISSPVISGASGGPVVDPRMRVIGVAIKGGRFEDEAPHLGRNTVVPIGRLDLL